jgi:lysophosphatidate acyltransferase
MTFLSVLFYFVIFYVAITTALFAAAHFTAPQGSQSTATRRSSQPHQAFSFWARILASVAALCACATYGCIASICVRVAGYGGLSQWITARSFKYSMWLVTGVWFDIINEGQAWAFSGRGEGGKEGTEGGQWLKTRPAVFMGNHQTELDVLMLGTMFPPYCSVTAKKSLQWVPFLGQFSMWTWPLYIYMRMMLIYPLTVALSRTVFIDRGNRKGAISAFEGAAKEMRDTRQSVYIFPEGTRSYATEPMLLPFKKGGFHLAVQAQVPIVPVVAANYSRVLSFKQKIFRSGRIPMKVLEPIETKGLTNADVDDLSARVREAMLKEIRAISKVE